MRTFTEETSANRPLTAAELNEVTGGLIDAIRDGLTFGIAVGGLGVAIGDQRGHVSNGIARGAFAALAGK